MQSNFSRHFAYAMLTKFNVLQSLGSNNGVSPESSANLWHIKRERREQVHHIVLPRKGCYSSQVSRVGVASVAERYKCWRCHDRAIPAAKLLLCN